MERAAASMFGDQPRTFAMVDEGRSVEVVCSICDAYALLSVPLPRLYQENKFLKDQLDEGIEHDDQSVTVLRVRAQLRGWIIPMTFGREVECNYCAEPEY